MQADSVKMEKIFGRNPVLEALRSDAELERVYIQDSISGAFEKIIRGLCQKKNIPLNRVPKENLDRRLKVNHQGIYAIVSKVQYHNLVTVLADLEKSGKIPLLVLLDGVQDVRNLGAIARSAEVFGADAIVLPSKGSAPVTGEAIKASAGALTHIPICREKNMSSAIELLARKGVELIGAEANGSIALHDLDLTVPIAIIFGAEGKGIDRNLKIYFDHHFFIPQTGKIDSLNVSVAAGIVLYEAHKQRL